MVCMNSLLDLIKFINERKQWWLMPVFLPLILLGIIINAYSYLKQKSANIKISHYWVSYMTKRQSRSKQPFFRQNLELNTAVNV